ncbi:MAG: flagellar motor protein MotB [Paludibacterium sp.]|uniref:flagellar motor protein MotB n=1 Tax=Paludibacterium sp. TaxID=1917523 RepID=UPI0025DF8F8E|nr:flagellar motor protein MotB [Paludibacterium sp.]MBV8047702.1 flagellar motor protein MotB [Paludibacterium sp.]MBV8646724.1 flagellar motor protein MotB [Paludibacterium sp.]
MADESQRPIIVKRIKKGGHGHHGGAWKIAYADFVTAMMAFFLLMWLLGSVSQGTLDGIADYFKTPLKVALSGGQGAGDATSVVKGGGTDLTRKAGQVKKNPQSDPAKEKAQLTQLQQKIQQTIDTSVQLKAYKSQLKLEMTPEGLRIQIVDEQNRSMFASGSSTLLPATSALLQALAKDLNQLPNRLSISGHTDATPYSGGLGGYSNWELSADRANAARRELIAGGLGSDKVLRVQGLADAVPLIHSDVFAAENRRITIVVLNRDAEQTILDDGIKPPLNNEPIGPIAPAPHTGANN